MSDERWLRFEKHEAEITQAAEMLDRLRHQGSTFEEWLRRPEITWDELESMSSELAAMEIGPLAKQQVEIETKYAGYIRRQTADIEKQHKIQVVRIPETFNFQAVAQLRREAKEKLTRVRPADLGQASRISGITPADLTILLLYLKEPDRLNADE